MPVGRRSIKNMNRLTNKAHQKVAFSQQLDRVIDRRESWAVFGPGRRWRYRLVRVWDSDKPRLAWVVFNGSDADEHRTDPTVRRCIGFARAWGYGGVDIANLYGLGRRIPGRLGATSTRSGPTTIATWPRCAARTTSRCWRGDPTAAPTAPTRWHRCFVRSLSATEGLWPCWLGPMALRQFIHCWRPQTAPLNA
jgi:Protein of unknown function (DUF1643)